MMAQRIPVRGDIGVWYVRRRGALWTCHILHLSGLWGVESICIVVFDLAIRRHLVWIDVVFVSSISSDPVATLYTNNGGGQADKNDDEPDNEDHG